MKSLLPLWKRGINLGNSLDAIGGETAWKNPLTTRPMIQMYADAGFDILRLPVTWSQHIGSAPDYTVDPVWMARVLEVAGWGVDAGMTVIVNTHHDTDWIRPQLSALSDLLPKFIALWGQIAAAFAGYGDEIILQGLNEPRVGDAINDQTLGTRDERSAVNALNHAFVRAVRESGGNNASRWLCVPPFGARTLPQCLSDMIVPQDEKIILTIHSYS
ncbi:MAG: glycoside hydrolase family 5 protein, partial [Firmicutes bacterium]|nr:glycoside hydrolase family 5 protein [Bacillota bacterium]